MATLIRNKRRLILLLVIFVLLLLPAAAAGQDAPAGVGSLLRIDMGQGEDPGKVGVVLQIFLLLTVLSLAPSILIMVTCFTRIAIVLSLLRQAMGTNQLPPNQIIIGLTLFLTFFIMTPVWQAVHKDALDPYLNNQLSATDAMEKAAGPIRGFMIRQTREKDLALMVDIAKLPRPDTIDDVPTTVLIPAFIISELKTAFQIGFMLYIPFLIIDMVVASVLLSMGMMMLPPIMVSLPFKLMIFVLTDGWYLIVGSLVKSFN
jgi:flagellar biosynthesis protein FliP